jgi:hypothetical protein
MIFKKGDKVICKPGFHHDYSHQNDPDYGGDGYRERRIIIVDHLSGGNVVWGSSSDGSIDGGVYIKALKLHYPIKGNRVKLKFGS